ncbi:peptide chain release factor N(5)-glutamine methyltransferase [Methylobacterium trifolii]|uniref:Release factor glutamine methyltransferase n=1 Tax=Methylobacterium trifolii TaxID=1003092 RepID=A0ABQ4TW88_9HYPH|nr:peptide chain release factor N(5)-glutamine methyltransferase [Methylobacterium trifolii]GJE58267.1 Release factor glutamine methyltransferase [Methylobacterium trifolii]
MPPDFDAGLSRRAALDRAVAILRAGGVEGAGDARFLVLGALGLRAVDLALASDAAIGAPGAAALTDALRRRLSGEPVARILGEWEFWGLPFRLSPATLVPRPDTETVVEAALRTIPDRNAPLRILDLGTGSGCILVALLSELPRAYGLGLDRSADALDTARANARANGVAARAGFVAGDWCAPLGRPFDLVVSNPPYIASAVIAGLAREVRAHDPMAALDGGADGLDAYRRILTGLGRGLLTDGGRLLFEVGFDQAEAVAGLGRASGLAPGGITRDLAGHARVVALARAPVRAADASPGENAC